VAATAAGTIATDGFQNRSPACPGLAVSFIHDTHFFNHARIFGELVACHDTQLLGRAAAHRETQILKLAANLGIADRAFRASAFSLAMMCFGVPAGARIANQELKKNPGRPDSETVGTSKLRQPALRGHADQFELTAAHQRRDRAEALKADGNLAGGDVGCSLRSALVGTLSLSRRSNAVQRC